MDGRRVDGRAACTGGITEMRGERMALVPSPMTKGGIVGVAQS